MLAELHGAIAPQAERINQGLGSHKEKAKLVNAVIASVSTPMRAHAIALPDAVERISALLVLQYCLSVVGLEYRHQVWPYEYMAFSRRVGELWERFCSVCWDAPSRANVERISEPTFGDITTAIRARIVNSVQGIKDAHQIEQDVDNLLELIGEVNMKEDAVFAVDGTPHVVDFKSGFGSNEKGNTLRLLAVGRAYKLWNPDTRLMLLVRQRENNNYLNVIRRGGLWEVQCNDDAYRAIDELTGANIQQVRREVVQFDRDLSSGFMHDIDAHLSDLKSYLDW